MGLSKEKFKTTVKDRANLEESNLVGEEFNIAVLS